MDIYQHTVKEIIRVSGIGLHSGQPVRMTIQPAKANSGIRFILENGKERTIIPAFMNRVTDTTLATTIGENGTFISTTEHLLAALAGVGIDNAVINVDGNEIPIMDGSAAPFVHVLNRVGRREQRAGRRVLRLLREVVYREAETEIRILPHDRLKITCEIDFPHPAVRRQSYSVELSPRRFMKEIAPARTFGFAHEVEALRERGLALGGSLDNAVVIDRQGVVNREGLRYSDEFVRHKILDLVGDLALLGCPIAGHVIARRAGHRHHVGLLREIVRQPASWELVKLEKDPESGVQQRALLGEVLSGGFLLPFFRPQVPLFTEEPCAA